MSNNGSAGSPLEHAGRDPLATIAHRIGARLVDWFLMFAIWLPVAALTSSEGADGVTELSRVGVIVWILVVVAYETILVMVRGQTLGKALVGIEIVRHKNGSRPGFGPSFLRVLPVGVAMAVLGVAFPVVMVLVYFTAGFMSESRGLLDRLAGTAVILARNNRGIVGGR